MKIPTLNLEEPVPVTNHVWAGGLTRLEKWGLQRISGKGDRVW